MIIEDEPRKLELLRKGIYENGFTVMTANNGETGLEMASVQEIDSIVLDIGLPSLDGNELWKVLRSRARNTPALALPPSTGCGYSIASSAQRNRVKLLRQAPAWGLPWGSGLQSATVQNWV